MACRAAAGCRTLRDAAIDSHPQPGRGNARPRTSGAPALEGMLGEGVSPRGPKPVSRQGRVSSAAVAARRLGGGRVLGGGRPGDPGLLMRLRARLPRIRPLRAFTVSVFSIALVGIVANAMVMQRGHHAAPLFGLGGSVDGQPDAAQRTVAVAPLPVSAPVDHTGTIAPFLSPAPVSAPADFGPPVAVATAKPTPIHHVAAKPHHQDDIGGLLTGTAPDPATHRRPGHPAGKPQSLHAGSAATLAHPDAAPQVKGHPKPHAAKLASAKAEPSPSKPVTKTE